MRGTLPISVCIIARDEERDLPRAIESVRAFAGEVVVVDTGSRDRTTGIARELGAKVLSFPWQDDFSLARNVALQAASCEWILSLDADEFLEARSLPALAVAIDRPCLAQMVTIDLVGADETGEPIRSFSSLRLFRRDERIRFRGRVHEGVAKSLLDIGCTDWPDSGAVIRDDGYANQGERQRKLARNLALLEQTRADEPGDLFVAYKLALTLPSSRRGERDALLLEAADKARALSRDALRGLAFMPSLLAAAVAVLVDQGRLCEAAEMAQRLAPAFGASCLFTAGRAVARTGQREVAAPLLARFLETGPRHPHTAVQPDPEANETEACRWLGWLSLTAGSLRQAQSWLSRALKTATSAQATAIECEVIRVSLAAGDVVEAARQLERLHPRAQGSADAYAELMLVSAELSTAVGDRAGAMQLARAGLTPNDERAAALLAKMELEAGTVSEDRVRQLMMAVVGRRFDTLAVRVMLARELGLELGFEIPAAAREMAAER